MTGLVADAVSAGLLVVNAEGRVVWVNAALAEVVGLGPAQGAAAAADEPSAAGADQIAERLDQRLPERARARLAVAEARLPLSGLVPGAGPVDVAWTAPDGAERWLRLRCQRLALPGEGWADGLTLYEVFDVTTGYRRDTGAAGEIDPAAGWAGPPGDEAWRGTPEWDQAAWGPPITDDTVVMARPTVPRPPVPPPGEGGRPVGQADPPGVWVAATPALSDDARLARIEELTRTGTWEWDLGSGALVHSRNMRILLGFDPAERVDPAEVQTLLPDLDLRMIRTALGDAIGTPGTFTFIHRLRDRVGQGERVFECFGEVVADESGRALRVLGTAHDITDLHRVQQELEHLAEHDALTGLFNRRALTRVLREHLAAFPAGREGSLLIIDVDHFKDVNDLRGHAVGDIVMRGLTQVLRDELSGGVLGRLGGDEFAVLLPTGDGAAGLAVAERLCQAVARSPIPVDDAALRVTVSIGVVPLALVDNETAALAQADLALYDSKGSGRDRARLFTDAQYEQAALRVSVTQRVRAALENGTLAVDALPLVDLAARRIIGYELLVRLRDGLSPELSPREFLEPVERTELVLRLDRWVVGQAVAALAADGPHGSLYLHVNVSARSVEDPGFGDFILDALRDAEVDPTRLGLEIAERSTLVSIEPARRLAEKLTSAGCRFILDDFGVGMGSVVHLRNLPFSGVKIDGDFVRQADVNPQDVALVDAVVRIARTLGMYTIAENVDREPLARVLADIGVDYAQGFHVGSPRPLAELLAEMTVTGADGDAYRAESAAAHPDRVEAEQGDPDRAERERVERAHAEVERAERERAERVHAEAERAERERVERERAEVERAERERVERERAEAERAERERAEREQAEAERAERVRLERERAEREQAERERADRERAEAEWAERERGERLRRDRLESERRRAENRGSVSWERPGLGNLEPIPGPPPPPPVAPPRPTFPGLSHPGAASPGQGPVDDERPGWSDGPASTPIAYPSSFPSVTPPSADQIPDYPPTGDLAIGGPPSGPVSLGGFGAGGLGGGFPRGGYSSNPPRSDGYQGGGYGGYDAARPDPLGLDRVGYLGRDPLFGPRITPPAGAGGQPAGGTPPAGAGGQDGSPGAWGTAGGAGPAPWDIVSVGGIVAAGPNPEAPKNSGGGARNGLDIGGISRLGGFGGAAGGATVEDDADGGPEKPAWSDGRPSPGDGHDNPTGGYLGSVDNPVDGHAGRPERTRPEAHGGWPEAHGGWPGSGEAPPRAAEPPRPGGGRGAHRPPEARDRGEVIRPRGLGGALPWGRRQTVDPLAGSTYVSGAGEQDPSQVEWAPVGEPTGTAVAPPPDSADTQVVAINGQFQDGQAANGQAADGQVTNGQVTNGQAPNGQAPDGRADRGPFHGLYRWP
ncbi:putative bifunctional diguanylate cyclase/phosphodiesterase [Frankia nepalensis]|uniref:putative bifunctional diguanylate cyclase/phosphodiesterase n=1 Tax=Frankia nepalensis TaxID=1836974 RepID=UPI0027DB3A5E|nr:EAL domain-containing protein [Frankia nepalensis]